jgi:hypothetical protein
VLWMPSPGRVSKREEKALSLSRLFVLIPLYKPGEKSLLYPLVKKLPTGHYEPFLEAYAAVNDDAAGMLLRELRADVELSAGLLLDDELPAWGDVHHVLAVIDNKARSRRDIARKEDEDTRTFGIGRDRPVRVKNDGPGAGQVSAHRLPRTDVDEALHHVASHQLHDITVRLGGERRRELFVRQGLARYLEAARQPSWKIFRPEQPGSPGRLTARRSQR